MAGKLYRLFVSFMGMLGLRLDQASWRPGYVLWVLAFVAGLLVYGQLFVWGSLTAEQGRPYALAYAAIVWFVYYGGLSLIVGTGLSQRMIERFGEERAVGTFTPVMGIVFQHQALAQGAVIDCWIGSMGLVPMWLMPSGFLLIFIGTGVKLWATHATSLDVYYYVDMFRGDEAGVDGELVRTGPFRWFRNPMYGVGNLQGYGSAMIVASWPGLLVAGAYHVTLYAFYFAFERPFVLQTERALKRRE
jgi:protein-S-isoprenylcysteine O-methyltransferase Ste14